MGKRVKTAAVAEISANGVTLKVGQAGKDGVKLIDELYYPLAIGRETFTNGKISFERADAACEILRNYAQAAREYGVDDVRVLATSAVREAANREYIVDQIRVKTGLTVDVLDSQEEKYHIYKLMCLFAPKELLESGLMVHIGSGVLGVAVLEGGLVTHFQSFRVGSLRLSELFEESGDTSRAFRLLAEEYLASFTDFMDAYIPNDLAHFICAGTETGFIGALCGGAKGGRVTTFGRAALEGLYEDVKAKSLGRVADLYQLTKEQAELLPPALSIYNNLLAFTNAERVHAPDADLADAWLWETLLPEEFAAVNEMFDKSAVISARRLAARFNCADKHSDIVTECAIEIFDRMKKAHGMGDRERRLLHAAAILHDAGKCVSFRHHYRHSYSLIRDLEIIGFSAEEMELIANIAMYHSTTAPNPDDPNLRALRSRGRATVAKLAAILRVADALDRAHKQKFDRIEAKFGADGLTVSVKARQDMALERWSFERKAEYFKEVYGVNAALKAKRS